MRSQPYELRFYRRDGAFSLLCVINFVSDRHAVSSARLLLNEKLPTVAVCQDGRRVADLRRGAPGLAA